MKLVTAPSEEIHEGLQIFLAGGISGCQDWQSEFLEIVKGWNVVFYNPRRDDFDMLDPKVTDIQIEWEHERLRIADIVLFWFSYETIQPITLFELGKIAATDKPLVVGCHPNYSRRADVIKQLELIRPDVHVVSDLNQLASQLNVAGVQFLGRQSNESSIKDKNLARARVELSNWIIKWQEKHCLSDVELMYVLIGDLHSTAKYAVKDMQGHSVSDV